MAHDALAAYQDDVSKGHDALLICDTTEMARALNQRLHQEHVPHDEPPLAVAHGQQIGVGDLIISRRNDPDVTMVDNPRATKPASMVRNGNRWRVAAIDNDNYRIAAVRLDDGAGAVFSGDYLRGHINLGYAVTVHSAQGDTADTSHAVLGENTTRNLLYVAMTRGRHTNTAHLYERGAEGHSQPSSPRSLVRGNAMEATQMVQSLIARDDSAHTAHQAASQIEAATLPDTVAEMLHHRASAVQSRHHAFRAWQHAATERTGRSGPARERATSLGRDADDSLGL